MTSPFLAPGIQFAWDSTSLGWFKECPRKYYYSMIRGYAQKGLSNSPHLFFGSVYQKCLETFDILLAEGKSHEEALHAIVRLGLELTWLDRAEDGSGGAPWESTDNNKTRFALIRSIVWHCIEYQGHTMATYIQANGLPAVEQNFKIDVGDGLMLCGHLDKVVIWDEAYYVMDHKTTKSAIDANYFKQFRPDNQMSLYTIAGQIIFDQPIAGVVIDAAQIMVGFTRFFRGFAPRTPDESEEWLKDFKLTVRYAHACGEVNYWPMNDKSCHDYGGCVFRSICGGAPSVRDAILDANFDKREWNPLIPRQ